MRGACFRRCVEAAHPTPSKITRCSRIPARRSVPIQERKTVRRVSPDYSREQKDAALSWTISGSGCAVSARRGREGGPGSPYLHCGREVCATYIAQPNGLRNEPCCGVAHRDVTERLLGPQVSRFHSASSVDMNDGWCGLTDRA